MNMFRQQCVDAAKQNAVVCRACQRMSPTVDYNLYCQECYESLPLCCNCQETSVWYICGRSLRHCLRCEIIYNWCLRQFQDYYVYGTQTGEFILLIHLPVCITPDCPNLRRGRGNKYCVKCSEEKGLRTKCKNKRCKKIIPMNSTAGYCKECQYLFLD